VAAVADTGAQETSAVPQPIERQSSASLQSFGGAPARVIGPRHEYATGPCSITTSSRSFGRQRLHEISQAEVQRWVNELQTRLATSSVRRSSVILMQIFQSAEDAGAIRHNPALRIRLPRVERKEIRLLSPDPPKNWAFLRPGSAQHPREVPSCKERWGLRNQPMLLDRTFASTVL
jgi:hypothetical protein